MSRFQTTAVIALILFCSSLTTAVSAQDIHEGLSLGEQQAPTAVMILGLPAGLLHPALQGSAPPARPPHDPARHGHSRPAPAALTPAAPRGQNDHPAPTIASVSALQEAMTESGLEAGALHITSSESAAGNAVFLMRSPEETLLDAAQLLKFLVQLERPGSQLSISKLQLEWSPSAQRGLPVWITEVELTQQTSPLPKRPLSALSCWAHLGRAILSSPGAADGLQLTTIDIQARNGQAAMNLAGTLEGHSDFQEFTGALQATGAMTVIEGWLNQRSEASLSNSAPLTFDKLEVSYTPQAQELRTPTRARR